MDEKTVTAVSASEFRNDLLSFANQVDELAEEIIAEIPNFRLAKYTIEAHKNFQKSFYYLQSSNIFLIYSLLLYF